MGETGRYSLKSINLQINKLWEFNVQHSDCSQNLNYMLNSWAESRP